VPIALTVTDEQIFARQSDRTPNLVKLFPACVEEYKREAKFLERNSQCNDKGMRKFTIGQAQLNEVGNCEPCTDYQNELIKCRNEKILNFLQEERRNVEEFEGFLRSIWNVMSLRFTDGFISFKKGGEDMCDWDRIDFGYKSKSDHVPNEHLPICYACRKDSYFRESEYNLYSEDYEYHGDVNYLEMDPTHLPEFLNGFDDDQMYYNLYFRNGSIQHYLDCMSKFPTCYDAEHNAKECVKVMDNDYIEYFALFFLRAQSKLNSEGLCDNCTAEANEMIKCRSKAFHKRVQALFTPEQARDFDTHLAAVRGSIGHNNNISCTNSSEEQLNSYYYF